MRAKHALTTASAVVLLAAGLGATTYGHHGGGGGDHGNDKPTYGGPVQSWCDVDSACNGWDRMVAMAHVNPNIFMQCFDYHPVRTCPYLAGAVPAPTIYRVPAPYRVSSYHPAARPLPPPRRQRPAAEPGEKAPPVVPVPPAPAPAGHARAARPSGHPLVTVHPLFDPETQTWIATWRGHSGEKTAEAKSLRELAQAPAEWGRDRRVLPERLDRARSPTRGGRTPSRARGAAGARAVAQA